jgi:hypothetical protein
MVEERITVPMGTFAKIAVIIAATGLVTTLVLPGRKTADVTKAGFAGLTAWTKAAQGR